MGEVIAELEKLKFAVEHGHAHEVIHVTWVERDQAERIKNNKRVTRFTLETKDPDACAELHAEWDRIIRRVHNKSIALSLIVKAWKEALADSELDKIMAVMDAPEFMPVDAERK
jgi:hypothetical protein